MWRVPAFPIVIDHLMTTRRFAHLGTSHPRVPNLAESSARLSPVRPCSSLSDPDSRRVARVLHVLRQCDYEDRFYGYYHEQDFYVCDQ